MVFLLLPRRLLLGAVASAGQHHGNYLVAGRRREVLPTLAISLRQPASEPSKASTLGMHSDRGDLGLPRSDDGRCGTASRLLAVHFRIAIRQHIVWLRPRAG